jgi:hypothetical protein
MALVSMVERVLMSAAARRGGVVIAVAVGCQTQRAPEPRKDNVMPALSIPTFQGVSLPAATPPAQYLAVFLHGIGDTSAGFAPNREGAQGVAEGR